MEACRLSTGAWCLVFLYLTGVAQGSEGDSCAASDADGSRTSEGTGLLMTGATVLRLENRLLRLREVESAMPAEEFKTFSSRQHHRGHAAETGIGGRDDRGAPFLDAKDPIPGTVLLGTTSRRHRHEGAAHRHASAQKLNSQMPRIVSNNSQLQGACESHADCPGEAQFCFQAENGSSCDSCDKCRHCHDGVDFTCGRCSQGYPIEEEMPCWVENCFTHSDCGNETPFCQWSDGGTFCQSCDACLYCFDGVDMSCGSCGTGYPSQDDAVCSPLPPL